MKKKLLSVFLLLSAVTASTPALVQAQTIVDIQSTNVNSSNNGSSVIGESGFNACSTIKTYGVRGIVNCIIAFFNTAVYLLISAAVVYVIYGAFRMISSEEGREEGKKTIYYGIIGLFVMVSIWGLVNILQGTFNLAGQGPLPTPQFNQPR